MSKSNFSLKRTILIVLVSVVFGASWFSTPVYVTLEFALGVSTHFTRVAFRDTTFALYSSWPPDSFGVLPAVVVLTGMNVLLSLTDLITKVWWTMASIQFALHSVDRRSEGVAPPTLASFSCLSDSNGFVTAGASNFRAVNRPANISLVVALRLTIPPHVSNPCSKDRLAYLFSMDPLCTGGLPRGGVP